MKQSKSAPTAEDLRIRAEKMSPIRHSTLCKSMKIDVKGCKKN